MEEKGEEGRREKKGEGEEGRKEEKGGGMRVGHGREVERYCEDFRGHQADRINTEW
jgi:hypothetical protein